MPTTSAFAALQHCYRDRLSAAREAQKRGQGVVGMMGNTVPVELVLAADRFPLMVMPEMGLPTPIADEYMEPSIAWDDRSLLDRIASGVYEFLDLLVLTREYSMVYYYLK